MRLSPSLVYRLLDLFEKGGRGLGRKITLVSSPHRRTVMVLWGDVADMALCPSTPRLAPFLFLCTCKHKKIGKAYNGFLMKS